MDAVVAAALVEISAQGSGGVPIASLWPKLAPLLSSSGIGHSPAVKSSLWSSLLKIPVLEFNCCNGALAPTDPSIQCVEDAEKMKLKVLATESLRDNFLGLYDTQYASANISSEQHQTLKRLAAAGEDGVTQSQLAKEFKMKGNYYAYILNKLESQGLITRQSAVVRTKEASDGGDLRNGPSVTTRVVYLRRYAKQFGSQQRVEITREKRSGNLINDTDALTGGECLVEDLTKNLTVKDYLPAMKAVCDKLESAEGKILVVSDIKRDLGYQGTSADHKAWRNVCKRLTDAGVVEEHDRKVNGKVHPCLRLLKNIPLETIDPNMCSAGNNENAVVAQFGRKCQITEQVIELPLEQQIFDMISAEGSVGVTLKEVSDRLGLDNKKNHTRIMNMVKRFGMHLESENLGKGVVYRVRAPKFSGEGSTNGLPWKSKSADNECWSLDPDCHRRSMPTLLDCNPPVSEGNLILSKETGKPENCGELDNAMLDDRMEDGSSNSSVIPQESDSGLDFSLVVSASEKGVILSGPKTPAPQRSSKSGSFPRYPCLSQTAEAIQRQQRILQRVQEERVVLRAELFKWLVNLEKEKCTKMDRKTIDRFVNKLQNEGHCRCVQVAMPSLTNCNHNRKIPVILHSSVEQLSPALISEIQDRMRSFEMQSRGHGSSKLKDCESVPVLEGVKRIQSNEGPYVAMNSKHEAMRANGFVLAKMIRAKLLHCFIWDYLRSLPYNNLDKSSSTSNPHSSLCLFSLEEAIKESPVELFLQVAGSTQRFDDLMEKCKSGLRLVDLPNEQYRILVDNLATGRLSKVVDILKRLKLIKLVNNGYQEDGLKVPHATLTHALELKPYIEEPLSILAKSFNFISLDLRPRVRHDFLLSSKEAVDEYWHTLEYCYSTADPKAAIHAFPGSAVPEVFKFRTWASARVMTAEQRAQLLQRVLKDCTGEKLSFKDCEKISKDLNLTLEQVLRVYHDKRQKRLTRFQNTVAEERACRRTSATESVATRKRMRSSRRPADADSLTEQLNHDGNTRLSDGADCVRGEPESVVNQVEHDSPLQTRGKDMSGEETKHNIENQGCSTENKMSTRAKRSAWTDATDRQIVIQYVRERAERGAKFHRVDWTSLSDLPAPPRTCGKRIAVLKKNKVFRRALMRLINIVSRRYVKHLQKMHRKIEDSNNFLVQSSLTGDGDRAILVDEEEPWDDFSCLSVKRVLEEVLRCKRITNLEASTEVQMDSEEYLNHNEHSGQNARVQQCTSSGRPCEDDQEDQETGQKHGSISNPKRRRLQKKFTKFFNKEYPVHRQIYESLAVSNAVELFKLIFLNSSAAPGMSNILAESLRHYSELDLFAAFRYLRDRKILIGGTGSQQYELPLNFIHDLSRSLFPSNTGRRLSQFAMWLQEREKNLREGDLVLSSDLQCGDIVHLFSLVFNGEMSISPRLPTEGVGEAEDLRDSKRGRAKDDESPENNKTKKSRFIADGEVCARREKGFPGIMVCARREAIPRAEVIDLSSRNPLFDPKEDFSDPSHDNADAGVSQGDSESASHDYIMEILRSTNACTATINVAESPWDAMARYAEKVMPMPSYPDPRRPLSPDLFKTIYGAIQSAGDQGLSIEEISDSLDKPSSEKTLELAIDVLQSFGRVIKVNAFDVVRVVDALYRPKYFLRLLPNTSQEQQSPLILKGVNEDHLSLDDKQKQGTDGADHMHKVTMLNLPHENDQTLSEAQRASAPGSSSNQSYADPSESGLDLEIKKLRLSEFSVPIVPWVNGDGTINRVVYRGLLRRVLGIVMLHPGILEDDIIRQLDVLNPQNARTFLQLMILDKHLIVRKMRQSAGRAPPSMLQSLLRSSSKELKKSIFHEHFFANPMSGSLL